MKNYLMKTLALVITCALSLAAVAQPGGRQGPPSWVTDLVPAHAADRVRQGGPGSSSDDSEAEEEDEEGEEDEFEGKRLVCHLNGMSFDNDSYLGHVISVSESAVPAHCGHPVGSDHSPLDVIELALEACGADEVEEGEEPVSVNSKCVHKAAIGMACSRDVASEEAQEQIAALCDPDFEPESDDESESESEDEEDEEDEEDGE